MRLTLLDPNLASEHGHHFDWDLAIAEGAAARGLQVHLVSNTRFATDLPVPFPVTRLFSRTSYEMPHRDAVSGQHDSFETVNEETLSDLMRLDVSGWSPQDILLFPTISELQLRAVVRWARSLPEHRSPRIVVHLQLDPGVHLRSRIILRVGDPIRALHYRLCLREGLDLDRLAFFAHSQQQAQAYSALAQRPIAVAPLPLAPAPHPRIAGAPRAVLFTGDAKIAKGLALVAPLAVRLASTHPEWRFDAHANAGVSGDSRALAALAALVQVACDVPSVSLETGRMDRNAYLGLLGRADLIVLPYSPAVYARACSGILQEAISMGVPLVVPADTWLEREALAWGAGHVAFQDHSMEGVARAFGEAAATLAALTSRSAEASRRFRRDNGMDRLLDALLLQARSPAMAVADAAG